MLSSGVSLGGPKSSEVPGEHDLCLAGGIVAELVGAVDEHRFESDHRRGAIFHGRVVGDFQLPDHLDSPVRSLRLRGRVAGQHSAGSVLRVESVGFSDEATDAAVGPVNLDDAVSAPPDERCQASSVRASSLDPEADDLSEPSRPVEQLLITERVGRDC
jgi:hypothetical protein